MKQLPEFSELPEFAERDLPPGRHRLLKEHLLTEIRHTEHPTERDTASAARGGRRWLRPALAAAAVATVAAVAFTVLPPSGPSGTSAGTSATLLEDVARAAEHDRSDVPARDDQFAYVDSRISAARGAPGGKGTVRVPLHRVESWISVDSSSDGLVRDAAEPRRTDASSLVFGHPDVDVASGYNHLKSLPTDPDAMYAWLEKTAGKGPAFRLVGTTVMRVEVPQAMFLLAGDLARDAILPPEQSAALYRAVARIPGVTLVPDVVDAAGRPGVGVARTDGGAPIRTEWIFDEKTHEFSGQRTTVMTDYAGFKKGTVVADAAVLRRAFVDEPGQRP
ncbi:CU044_5270 family protein [Streptomyces longwoodensis]|uniref:CU044_5270 family protein n=1 Tax=Streptomyces longwoodensis TaxID=68231 RepID=UPI0036E03433